MRVNSPPPLRGGANAFVNDNVGRDDIFLEREEDEDEKQRKAIQRLCDLSDQIDQARDANQFQRAIELMREQVRLFRVQATMSEEEREAMEPLIQSALEEIEEMRGKLQREEVSTKKKEEKEEGKEEKNNTTTMTTTTTTSKNTLIEVDKNTVLTKVISPAPGAKPGGAVAPFAATRRDNGGSATRGNEKQGENKDKEDKRTITTTTTTAKVLETKAAWGIPVSDGEEENAEYEVFRVIEVAKQQEKEKKSYGELKKEKEAREEQEKKEKKEKKTLTRMEQLQEEGRRTREASSSKPPVQRVVNYGKPPPSIRDEKQRLVTTRTIDPREEENRGRRQSPRKNHRKNKRGGTSGASRYRVDDDDDNGMTYNNNNTRKKGHNKRISGEVFRDDDDDDDEDVVICDDEHHHANGAAGAKPKTARFMTAGDKLDFERAQKGLAPVMQPYREAKEQAVLKAGSVGGRNSIPGAPGGFIGPFGHLNGGNANNSNGQQKNKDDPNGDSGPAFSELALKRLQPTGKEVIPDEILKLERDIVERVIGEVLDKPGTVSWDSIVGLEHAKNAVQELAVWPMTNPELFTGARAVPKGLLLFGPPGTGKTMIGKAVASQCKATFFSISASSLTSKWIGDGEKMVRALFAVARHCAPSVIFVDEIDSLLSARKSEGEHESSRRMKTEFLVQMDGLGGEDPTKPMLLIGATNRPQELDDGARRRLAKQLYIPLPCAAARRDMILKTLNPDGEGKVKHALTEKDLDVICEKTDGYSGSDLKNLVQEAARAPLRELFAKKKARTEKGDGGGDVVDLTKSGEDEALELREIRIDDIRKAAKQVRASVTRADIEFHEEWNKKHGALTADEVEDDGEW
jgi:SpoVK/Ycf46/Vps4 family AAA+-type ATPase